MIITVHVIKVNENIKKVLTYIAHRYNIKASNGERYLYNAN